MRCWRQWVIALLVAGPLLAAAAPAARAGGSRQTSRRLTVSALALRPPKKPLRWHEALRLLPTGYGTSSGGGGPTTITVMDGMYLSAKQSASVLLDNLGLLDAAARAKLDAHQPVHINVDGQRLVIALPSTKRTTMLELANKAINNPRSHQEVAAEAIGILKRGHTQMIRKRGVIQHCHGGVLELLEALGGSGRILVTGAGEGMFAKELLGEGGARPRRPPDVRLAKLLARVEIDKPYVTSMDLGAEPAGKRHPKHRFISGKLLSETSTGDLCTTADGKKGKYNLILDEVAVLTYTPDITADFNKMLAALEVGGTISVATTDAVAFVRRGKLELLPEAIARIDGVKVDWAKPPGQTNGTYLNFRVTKTSDKAKMPRYKLLSCGDKDQQAPQGACSSVRIYGEAQ
ncbi:MAG: hypothetical protein KC503_27035 [Myxococcales bacterium]|nr:hypothetical protein [Myxococcales bacterium]